MTESRDQRFFDALANAERGVDQEPTTAGDQAGQAPRTAPDDPGPGFAADGPDDPAAGKHHVGAPADSSAGGWGHPEQPSGAAPQTWPTASPAPMPAQPWPPHDRHAGSEPPFPRLVPQLAGDAPQPTPRPPGGTARGDTSPVPPSAPAGDSGDAAGGPENPHPGPGSQETAGPAWPPLPPGDGRDAPPPAAPRPAPREVPVEERTQFLSRDALREATRPRTAAPPAAWRPAPGQRPPQPPGGWPSRGRQSPPLEPSAPSGPRAPEWDWAQGTTGGAELRGEQINASALNAPKKTPSAHGWRKVLYHGTFKLINTGESPAEQVLRNLNTTVARHLRGTYSIVVLGGKGGVGKTTTTATIGSVFASLRKDKAIAIDANPDRASNLHDRIDPTATNSYKDVLSDPHLQRYSDIRSHVGMNEAGLDVLGNRYQSDRPPLTAKVYTDTHAQLQRFYSVLINDSGTDVDHPVIPGLMDRADALIMVASTAPDGAKGAAELMDWAYEAGHHRLLQRTVVVINEVRHEKGKAHRKLVESLVELFSRWVGPQRVFVVPFDPHIASAGVIDIDDLHPRTRRRYLEITASVAQGFNSSEDRQ